MSDINDPYENSWIKLPRDFVNWMWYHDSNMVQLYLYLILNAQLESSNFSNVFVDRGQIIITLKDLSRDTGMSIHVLRLCLQKLTDTNFISYRELGRSRIIIVVEYNKFQPIGIDESNPNWIKLYRKIANWTWFKKAKTLHLFVHFMIKSRVAYLPSTNLPVWQCSVSLSKLKMETNISIQSLRTCIRNLQRTGEIVYSFVPGNESSLVTICKYDTYQVSTNDVNGVLKNQKNVKINTAQKSTQQIEAANVYNTEGYNITNTECGHNVGTKMAQFSTVLQHNNQHSESNITFEKSTQQNMLTTDYDTDTYEDKKNNMGTMWAQSQHGCGHNNGHNVGTIWAQSGHYNKNKRIKDYKNNIIINDNNSACACGCVCEESTETEIEKAKTEPIVGESLFDLLRRDGLWLKAIMRKFGFSSAKEMSAMLENFQLDLVCRGKEEHRDLRDLKSHFCDWMKLQKSPPSPTDETMGQEKPIGERFLEERNATAKNPNDEDEKLRKRIVEMIELLQRNPHSLCRKVVIGYLNDGTMARLGINWQPIEEEMTN